MGTSSTHPVPAAGVPSTFRSILARWCPGIQFFRCTPLRIAGMLPVLLVLGIHFLIYTAGVYGTLLPLREEYPLVSSTLLAIFHFVFVMAIVNYLLLVLADPGSVPDDWKAPPPPTFSIYAPPLPLSVRLPINTANSSSSRNLHAPNSAHSDQLPTLPPSPSFSAKLVPPIGTKPHSVPSSAPPILFKYAHLMHERTYEGYLRYCNVCKSFKPDRSHHCSVCRRCILKMDHHCIFVNNCVSFYNHKFFIAFITYAFLGCLIVSIISFPTFADIISLTSGRIIVPTNVSKLHETTKLFPIHAIRDIFLTATREVLQNPVTSRLKLVQLSAASRLSALLRTLVLIGYISASAFSFALAIFVALHYYLVSKGRTTIEMYEMNDPVRASCAAQYDLGFRQNVKAVCGSVPLCWLFPTRAYIGGDGVSYNRRTPSHMDTSAV